MRQHRSGSASEVVAKAEAIARLGSVLSEPIGPTGVNTMSSGGLHVEWPRSTKAYKRLLACEQRHQHF